MNFSDVKGFAFDLDGVIADTARFHGEAWHQIADEVGTTWTAALAEKLKGISRMESLQMILDASNKNYTFSQQEKEKLAENKNFNYQQLISKLNEDDILPGMKKFIESLKLSGYRMVIASASKNAPLILENLGLTDYFDGIVNPDSLTKGKPDPEIFIRAAEVMQLDPKYVIGLEDSSAGIESINAAGEISLAIGDADILKNSDLNFSSTSEITINNIKNKLA